MVNDGYSHSRFYRVIILANCSNNGVVYAKVVLSVRISLFSLTMHVMFRDVKSRLNDLQHQNTFQGINFQKLFYADGAKSKIP